MVYIVRKGRLCAFAIAIVMLLGMAACANYHAPKDTVPEDAVSRSEGQIYLYGEQHGNDAILEKELELWYDHYHKDGMRHLFLEHPYYTAEFLNIWMTLGISMTR